MAQQLRLLVAGPLGAHVLQRAAVALKTAPAPTLLLQTAAQPAVEQLRKHATPMRAKLQAPSMSPSIQSRTASLLLSPPRPDLLAPASRSIREYITSRFGLHKHIQY
jgi:hypothetical protein